MMTIICCYCGLTIGQKPSGRKEFDGQVSHGCCDACYKKVMAEIEQMKIAKNS